MFDVKKHLTIFLVTLSGVRLTSAVGLAVFLQWRYLDWVPPSVESTGREFIAGNPFVQDVDVDFKRERIFVTSPQWPPGVPIVLSTVTGFHGPGGPLLEPYPSADWHKGEDCNSLISVFRITTDECNRLWVVDIGRIGNKTICPTKILVFDLNNDRLLHKYVVPQDQTLYGGSTLVTPIVEVGKTCLNAYLYMGDVLGNGIVLYDLINDRSFRINNTLGNAFGPDDDATYITIAGETFDLTDGILGLSLSPPGFFHERYLFFNSLASYYQKFASTSSLKTAEFREPVAFRSNFKRLSQAGVQATSRTGAIFFQLVQLTAVACWNIEKPFIPENVVIVAQDEVHLQYVSGIKVLVNGRGQEELWFVTNRLQKTINNSLDPREVNFRVIRGRVDDLIRGTNCEPTSYPRPKPLDFSSWHRI